MKELSRSIIVLLFFSAALGSCVSELSQQQAAFVGSHTCTECHQDEYQLWKGSDHDNAMDTAIASTVLGDFDNAEFEWNGFVSKFYTREGKYFVHTQGTGGKAGDFQIAYTFGDFVHPRGNVYDILSPQLPIEPYYYPDGQILEEDYVYASFTQSKMHQNKVRCSNCHDVHSLKLKKQGNDLCMQCHEAAKYNTYDHHFHKDFNEQGDPLIKATATNYLSMFPQEQAQKTTREMLNNPEAVVRREAVRGFRPKDLADLIQSLVPLLNDPTKMVRMEVVAQLSAVPLNELDTIQKQAFQAALAEYIEAMEYTADFAASRHNLGNLYTNLGQLEKAEANYLEAIRIDEQFFPAIINLAMLYNRMNQNGKAEILLKHMVNKHPGFDEAYYSLGLLLGEMQKYDEAIVYLEKAAERMPGRSRIFFHLYQLQLFKDQTDKAETSLQQCLILEPGNLDYCYAAIEFYLKAEQPAKAREYARQALRYHPDHHERAGLEQFIQGN